MPIKNISRKIAYSLIGLLIGYILYREIIGILVTALIVTMVFSLTEETDHQKLLTHEFRLFLNGVYTELLVGNALRNAVENTANISPFHHKKMLGALQLFRNEIALGQQESKAWENFAKQLDLKNCDQFVTVLNIAYLHGSNLQQVVKETIKILTDQMDLELDLEVVIAAKKFEFYIMLMMPIALLGLMSLTDYTYMSVLYTTFLGRIVMTLVFIANVIAYLIGKKLIRIEV